MSFRWQQARIRREVKSQIKAGVPEDQLHHIAFSNSARNQIDWTRKNFEFRLNGEMFDIVFSETKDDSIHFYCINDREEKLLFENLAELVKKRLGEDSRSSKSPIAKLIRAIKSLVYFPDGNEFPLLAVEIKNIYPTNPVSPLSTPFLDKLTPPPKAA